MWRLTMRTLKNFENKSRGSAEFPCKLYRVDKKNSEYFMPFHWHTEYELIYVRKGVLELSADDHGIILSEGDTAFLSDGVLHGGSPRGDGCVYDCVVFSPELITKNTSHSEVKEIFRNGKAIATELLNKDYPRVCKSARRICDRLYTLNGEADELITIGIFYEFLGEAIRSGAVRDGRRPTDRHISRLKNVISYIDMHYSEKISLGELSDVAGISPKYLCRSFYSLTGKTPIAYILQYRIECAMEMLKESEMSMSDIAVSCGFGDQSYFVKQFKRFVGKTPREYKFSEMDTLSV